jgi:glycosyltransferase involved in cell wall biosynthesis
MRVLYLNPFSQEVSGPDESLLGLLGHLVPRGVEAHVVLPRPGPQVDRYRAIGATVHFRRLTTLRRRATIGEAGRLAAGAVRSLPAMAALCRALRPDLIHTNMEVVLDGALIGRALGVPHVMHYRGNTLDEPKLVFDGLTWLWTRLSLRVFCISESTAAVFRARGRDRQVEVLYNPIDLAAFAAAVRVESVRASLGAREGAPLVGTVGRLHPRKDLETFVRAAAEVAAEIPDARFAVVGAADGPEEEAYLSHLRALAAELAIDARLTWVGARRDIPAVMKAMDVFVLSSRHEGFGRALAEAMAAGLPVVATDEGALPELVADGQAGLLAPAGAPAAFAARIVELLRDPPRRAALGAAAHARSRAFDGAATAERVLAVYRQLAPR